MPRMVIVLMATVSCIGPIDCGGHPATDCCIDGTRCSIHGIGSDKPGDCTPCGQLGQICCLGATCDNAEAVCVEDGASDFGYCVMRFPDAAPTDDAPSDDGGLDAMPD